MSGINPLPWQTDTSNGDWFYADGDTYKTGAEVIRMLADIVSKNGNLLLNVVLYPDGSLPPESQTLLAELDSLDGHQRRSDPRDAPMDGLSAKARPRRRAALSRKTPQYTAQDIRFTTKGKTLYAITLGEPSGRVAIASLGRAAGTSGAPSKRAPAGRRAAAEVPADGCGARKSTAGPLPTRHASAFKISFRT